MLVLIDLTFNTDLYPALHLHLPYLTYPYTESLFLDSFGMAAAIAACGSLAFFVKIPWPFSFGPSGSLKY